MTKRTILGLTEQITIMPGPNSKAKAEIVTARIDTGATLSSIDSELAKELGIEIVIGEKVVKSASGKTKRSVVSATIKIKDQIIEGEFSLANREDMKYQVLIGQNHLKKCGFLVDPQLE